MNLQISPTMQFMISNQIEESEQETKEFLEEQTRDNISDVLSKQKQKERGFILK